MCCEDIVISFAVRLFFYAVSLFLFPRVFYFCSEVILLCCEDIVISFAVRLFFYAVSLFLLPRVFYFCREVFSFAVRLFF